MPSVRRRLVRANARSNLRGSERPASAVIWLMIAPGRAAATASTHGAAVEAVEHDRLGAEGAQRGGLLRAPRGARDGVAVVSEEGDEGAAGGAGGSCEEDVHTPPTRRRGTL